MNRTKRIFYASWAIAAIFPIGLCATNKTAMSSNQNKTDKMKIDVTSSVFQQGQPIPKRYTADGADVSPPLQWQAPAHTKSVALICDDPDAPMGTWTHWVIFDIPASENGLKEAVPTDASLPDGAKQGVNSFHKTGYGGPSPPPGKPHRYFFHVFALDSMPASAQENPRITAAHSKLLQDIRSASAPENARLTEDQLKQQMQGHVIGEGELMGTYGR